MDNNIRLLLASAQKYGVQGEGSFLHQAYEQLRTVAETRPTATGGPEPIGQDLFVICAEIAFQCGLTNITKECLKMYFMKTPPPNQFMCRAYLCQAQLLAPTTSKNPEQLEKSVVYLVKAISFAKENSRYHFLVYNASVLYWQFCRPFLKPRYRQYLSISLHSVVKALDDIEDKDYEWRARLMIALVECHVDAGRVKEAAEVSKATAEFTKANVPALYKQVLGLQVQHNLVEASKLAKEVKANADLNAYFKICRLKVQLQQKDGSLDIAGELEKAIHLVTRNEGDPMTRPPTTSSGGGRQSGAATPAMAVSGEDRRPVIGDNQRSESPAKSVSATSSLTNVLQA